MTTLIEFSSTVDRCASCGQRGFHWAGCKSKTVAPPPEKLQLVARAERAA